MVIHEVTETTRLKLSHGDTLGTTSFVLTTETIRSGAGEGSRHAAEERPRPTTIDIEEIAEPEDELMSQMKEVRQPEDSAQSDSRYSYHHHITRHAVKGIL